MSTTLTKKDEKEIAKDVAAMESVINNLSYEKLQELLDSKKQTEIENKTKELTAAKGIVASLEAQLVKLGVVTAPVAPAKRTYIKKAGKAPKAAKKTTGKRDGGLKETILKFLSIKGKDGAHVDDIAKHAGKPKANINAFLATTGKKAGVKSKGNRSGIYFIK